MTTIQDVIYMGMHNDVSFIIGKCQYLFEQQATFNPNMPLRMLQYAGSLSEQYLTKINANKYGRRQIMLPVPKFVVFYNGIEEMPDEMLLTLRSAFPQNSDPDIDVRVRMLNINYGHSKDLLDACRSLREYAWFIEQIRHRQLAMSIELAVDAVMACLPEDFVLYPFLTAHKSEVRGMLLTEYDEVKTMNMFKDEGDDEGYDDGL